MLSPIMVDAARLRQQFPSNVAVVGAESHVGQGASGAPPLCALNPEVTISSRAERLYRALAPAVFGGMWLASRCWRPSPASLDERAGWLPEAPSSPLLWFHGASAGELTAAMRLAGTLRASGYAFTAGYTSTNQAGLDVAHAAPGPRLSALVPWDITRWVRRALDRWKPAALFLVETELWPTLVGEAARRGVPVFCVSARIYPRDVARYGAIRWLMAPTLCRVTAVLAQSEVERARYLALGAPVERCVTAGNLKYLEPPAAGVSSFGQEVGLADGQSVVVCGSLHSDEMALMCAALKQCALPTLRMIIAPRHPADGRAVVAWAQRYGWKVHRRSAGAAPHDWQVLVLDTMGELPQAYRVATIAVVGGGFGRHGGHNPFEPVRAGVPVLLGRHFDHFAQDAIALTAETPEAQVRNAEELGCRMRAWLTDRGLRDGIRARQRAALPNGETIARRYVALLAPWLEGVRA